jgi:hypothetical protein
MRRAICLLYRISGGDRDTGGTAKGAGMSDWYYNPMQKVDLSDAENAVFRGGHADGKCFAVPKDARFLDVSKLGHSDSTLINVLVKERYKRTDETDDWGRVIFDFEKILE